MSEERTGLHNKLEKLVFFLGAAILLGVVGYLSYLISLDRSAPPILVVTSAYKPDIEPYGFLVTVRNFGEEAAKNVTINLELFQNGQSAETGTLQIDYVPISSSETGWIVFDTEKKQGDSLVLSSMTFAKP